MNIKNGNQLKLSRCPHCGIADPSLNHAYNSGNLWYLYSCATCTKMILTRAAYAGGDVVDIWPSPISVSDALPMRAQEYLKQAMSSLHAPAGALMLAACAVDAMLKDKGFKTGSLHSRINQAMEVHLITKEMAEWAHEIRLDANEQRHADEAADLPSSTDAQRILEFATALAQFLYVLPSMVATGRKQKPSNGSLPSPPRGSGAPVQGN